MKNILQNFNDCFNLASEISKNEDKTLLISVLENWEFVHGDIRPIFIDLIEGFGFYPYLKEKQFLNDSSLIRNEYHKSKFLKNEDNSALTFHFEQKQLEEQLTKEENLLVSAPTSFGKSLLIEELVARKKYYNILIIQPTLALIDETRRKLQKYNDFYNIVVNTKQDIKEKNIFILTSERVLDIFSLLPSINLFVVDEFYKISNWKSNQESDDRQRVSALNIAFYKIMNLNPKIQLLLLTPNIDDINDEFINKYNLKFVKTNYSLVNQQMQKIDCNKKNKKNQFFALLKELEEPTIVYVKSPAPAEKLADAFIEYNSKRIYNTFPIFDWIDENISANWKLKKFLANGIGIHNGRYPRHIVNAQLDYFNEKKIKIIFATSSLIEGVNSVAKNIIIYDMYKGKKPITHFDFNNIKGRAGRMFKYYTGNIYYFDDPPENEKELLDIPIIDQKETLQSEILVNLKKADIKEHKKAEYENLVKSIPSDLLEIFKKNYYAIEKQKNLYYFLKKNPNLLAQMCWTTATPNYNLLQKTFEIVDHQLKGKEGNSSKFLTQKCQQITRDGGLRGAIQKEYNYQREQTQHKNKSDEKVESIAINKIFEFVKNDANYKIPRLLSILESIVNYLSNEQKADYSAFISLLGSEGVNEKLSFLLDYGIPASALKKMKNPPNDNVIFYIKNNIDKFDLNNYEYEILKKAL